MTSMMLDDALTLGRKGEFRAAPVCSAANRLSPKVENGCNFKRVQARASRFDWPDYRLESFGSGRRAGFVITFSHINSSAPWLTVCISA